MSKLSAKKRNKTSSNAPEGAFFFRDPGITADIVYRYLCSKKEKSLFTAEKALKACGRPT